MLGDWMQHQAIYGKDARGVWFRRSKPETEEAQARMPDVRAAMRYACERFMATIGTLTDVKAVNADFSAVG